jgi:hypothetical protein
MITNCPHHCIPANGPPGSQGTQPVPPGRTELDDPDPDEQSHGEVELRGKRPTTQCGQQQQPRAMAPSTSRIAVRAANPVVDLRSRIAVHSSSMAAPVRLAGLGTTTVWPSLMRCL